MWKSVIVFLELWMTVYPAEDTLRLVHVILRHCERTPDPEELYPTSYYYNETTFAPYGHGQIINEGKRKCYAIGTALRERYQGFLDPVYHYSKVEARSSSYGRAKEVLQLVLAGLFPPTKELTWSTELNWSPIATYHDIKARDMIEMPYLADEFLNIFLKFEETEEVKKLRAPYENLRQYVSQNIGQEITFRKLGFMSLGIQILGGLGLDMPEWMMTLYPNISLNYYIDYTKSYYCTEQLKRLALGYFFRKIIDDTEAKINETSHKQIVIHSAHDLTIITVFVLLDVWNFTLPPVGSYCTWEVHQINGIYGFKLYYFNNTPNEPYLIHVPGFGAFALLEELKNKKKKYLYLDDLNVPSNSMRPAVTSIIGLLLCIILRM